jgi:hypothetical protein
MVLRCKEMGPATASVAAAWEVTRDHRQKLSPEEGFCNRIGGVVAVAIMAVKEEVDSTGAVVLYHVDGIQWP